MKKRLIPGTNGTEGLSCFPNW